MAADEMRIDPLSLLDFEQTIQARLDENFTAIRALSNEPGSHAPALGGFVDARQTADRYVALHKEYVVRLNRLVAALAAAKTATAGFAREFRTIDELNTASAEKIRSAMSAVSAAVDGGNTRG
jgi:hypothetical protein